MYLGASLEDQLIILVVEDDALIQTLVEDVLGDGGFEVVLVDSGEEAIKLLDGVEPIYRALVTDINLENGNLAGWDVARHAREVDPNLPVVYMTGDSAVDWAAHGVPNSILLAKPFVPAQLLTAVSQLLNAAGQAHAGANDR